MSWTINEQSKTSVTQYFNASYSTSIIAPLGAPIDSVPINVSGYTAGTISFSLDSAPTGWGVGTMDISILGGINVNSFEMNTLTITVADGTTTTYYVEWSIPLETVALRIVNTATGGQRTINSIRMMTESYGGGIGNVSSSGSTTTPGAPLTSIQFNDGGIFGGASGALYDKTANTNTGQVQLANGSVTEPILAFSDGVHPAGDYDTGIYRVAANTMGFSANSSLIAGVSRNNLSVIGGTAAIPGINFGVTGTDIDTGMYRVALTAPLGASAIGFSTGTQQKVTIVPGGVGVTPPTGMIEGLNVGLTSDIAGIRRLSVNNRNSWEDGNCGNSEFIVFTATDFMQTTSGGGGTVYPNNIGNVSRGPVVNNVSAAGDIFASKLIPKGFILRNGGRCSLFSDVQRTISVPQSVRIEIYAQEIAGPTVSSGVVLAAVNIPAGGGGWETSGDGSVNRTGITPSVTSLDQIAAATGTGTHVVSVFIQPSATLDGAVGGGIVSFVIPIIRI